MFNDFTYAWSLLGNDLFSVTCYSDRHMVSWGESVCFIKVVFASQDHRSVGSKGTRRRPHEKSKTLQSSTPVYLVKCGIYPSRFRGKKGVYISHGWRLFLKYDLFQSCFSYSWFWTIRWWLFKKAKSWKKECHTKWTTWLRSNFTD